MAAAEGAAEPPETGAGVQVGTGGVGSGALLGTGLTGSCDFRTKEWGSSEGHAQPDGKGLIPGPPG